MNARLSFTDPTLVVRQARKQWRCICADEFKSWRVDARPYVSTVHTYRTRKEAIEAAERYSGRLEGVRNPNYRSDCLGDIMPGDTYVEYMGEASPYEHGTSYCMKCAVEAWKDYLQTA